MSPRAPIHGCALGVSTFCAYALEYFHLLAVLALKRQNAELSALIWIIPAVRTPFPSTMEVKNALNFCLSIAPHWFEVSRV